MFQSCLLTCPTSTNMTLCVWQQGDLSEDEFQAFIDRFTQGQEFCWVPRRAKAMVRPPFDRRPCEVPGMFRSNRRSHFRVSEFSRFFPVQYQYKNRMGEFVGIAASSENGDDLKTKFAASFGVPLGTYACASLFTEGADAACMWSSGEDVSIEDFQKYVDSFTTSACKNTVYAVDTGMSCNVMGLSEDLFLTEQIAWAKAAVATPTEEALEKKKAHLIECGLPEAQAAISVATDLPGGFKETTPSSCFYTHVIKPDGNVDEALKWFAEYTKAAKNSKGHSLVSHTYNPETREIIAIDVISGPNAMDNHIGNCFPAYAKMIGSGVEMKECVAIVPADEVEWWTNSLKVWGASRFIVKTDHTKVEAVKTVETGIDATKYAMDVSQ
ncbi:hypothetical protein THAOC_29771 [Thalassiosira oceanica]|uniref:Uncharacterized protein n=1 Tax=Thalassiosira oceanica TaxID=159749 RepID=K0RD30_THAOC|nr:hypothetical protein THAOC_29771 [Thalassiosira oceanica]|eukprot:EJK51095.1 hypothetical protein THAOC_29771 [Thalassiosira oceanica]